MESTFTRHIAPINPSVFPHLATVLLIIGTFFTAWFFVFEGNLWSCEMILIRCKHFVYFAWSIPPQIKWKRINNLQRVAGQFICCHIFGLRSAIFVAIRWYLCLINLALKFLYDTCTRFVFLWTSITDSPRIERKGVCHHTKEWKAYIQIHTSAALFVIDI